MNYSMVIPLSSLIVSTYILTYVYSLDPSNPLNRAYSLYALSPLLWIAVTLFVYIPIQQPYIILIIKIASVFWLPIGFLFMNLTYVSLRKKRDYFYWVFGVSVTIVIILSITTKYIISGYQSFSWGFWHTSGPLFLPSVFTLIAVPVLYSIFLIIRRIRSMSDSGERQPLLLLLFATLSMLSAALTLEIFAPQFIDNTVIRLSPSSTVIGSILIYFAIKKYHILTPDLKDIAADLFSSIQDGVILMNNRGDVLRINSVAQELFHLASAKRSKTALKDLMQGYSPTINYKDHEIFSCNHQNLLITQSPLSMNNHQIGRVLMIKNITPIKALMEETKKSEERFRSLVEDISEVIYSVRSDSIIEYMSPAIQTITGYTPDEIIGTSLFKYIHPDDLPMMTEQFSEALKGKHRVYEFRIISKNGLPRYIITMSKQITLPGEGVGLRGVLTDTTNYKIIKQELEESQRLYSLIANNVTDKIWIYDFRTLKVTYTSPSVMRLNGRTPEEEMAIPPQERIEKESLKKALTLLQEEIENDASRDPHRLRKVEFIELHADGRWINMEARITLLRDETGKPVGVLGVSRDITEQKILERELKESIGNLRQRNEIIEKDIATARLIHQKLLPSSAPEMDAFRIDFRYLPLEAVGGDYFSFTVLEEGGLGVFIGDVTGHGVPAALFLSLVKSATNNLLRDHALNPSSFFQHLNHDLFHDMQSYFITAIYGWFRNIGNEIVFSFTNGGHPPPLLYRSATNTVQPLDSKGIAIGMVENSTYSPSEISLQMGDRIYLYTDGLVEVMNESNAFLGYAKLPSIILNAQKKSLTKTLDRIIQEIHQFRGNAPLHDDIVLIGIEVR